MLLRSPNPAERSAAPLPISFSRSIAPYLPCFARKLAGALASLAGEAEFLATLRDSEAGGSAQDREAGAAWLSPRFGEDIDPGRVLVTNGTQGAILLLMEHLVGRDGLVVAEALSYTPLDRLAARAHLRLTGLALDADGLVPESFAQACRTAHPSALYCNPTMHNPTATIMPEQRRLEIAGIAAQYGVAIIEDDPLGKLHPGAPRPIAALAPRMCWYVSGATKPLAHGLRIAYVVGPSVEATEALLRSIRDLSHWFPARLAAAVVTRWVETGAAEELAEAVRGELAARQAAALAHLRGDIVSPAGGMHLWMRLPAGIERGTLVQGLAQRGVIVRPADVFAVDEAAVPNAVRLSLSSPPTLAEVEEGLRIVARTLEDASA